MSRPVRLAVAGAGLIGRRHIEQIIACPEAVLTAVIDPAPAARELAQALGVRWSPSLDDLPAEDRPEGVVIATPNRMHVANGMACLAAGLPALIEKPLADDVAAAQALVEAFERAGVPLLTGHHRRHNPMIQRAKAEIENGRLGRIVAVSGLFWLIKPDDYFDAAWRREPGAGPVLINLIHDIDLLRHLCGDIVAVQAAQSNRVRGHAVEDTAAIILHFASGALGTFSVSDTVQAPWSYEFTSGENPAYSRTQESCYQIGGTKGSLAIPQLDLWRHPDAASWWAPIASERLSYRMQDPLALQIANFCAVIRGTAAPVVSGREGLTTLRVIAAIKRAAASGICEPV
ncbi:Gfo/Idh/MocA family oxidoreductase [Bradyrhizobium sp. STM 3809]|uniref:Gfo/Idh/MocA family protein n=1 Tax=Bradyrhizobium sp. STM 3809 TaxID=551936 RepID=UPI0002405A71|nr:Gfo/Idh/MocA family oxidoreductase [Bradyrhizobium sp. STM 3809]CCD98691.1 putative NAD(P)-dependent oxidoreductase (Inositol 2-dehydrogenase) [Bradyrhizobium sp. STM 3809]